MVAPNRTLIDWRPEGALQTETPTGPPLHTLTSMPAFAAWTGAEADRSLDPRSWDKVFKRSSRTFQRWSVSTRIWTGHTNLRPRGEVTERKPPSTVSGVRSFRRRKRTCLGSVRAPLLRGAGGGRGGEVLCSWMFSLVKKLKEFHSRKE